MPEITRPVMLSRRAVYVAPLVLLVALPRRALSTFAQPGQLSHQNGTTAACSLVSAIGDGLGTTQLVFETP